MCHKLNVYLGKDIKPDNILLNLDADAKAVVNAKLADCGKGISKFFIGIRTNQAYHVL